MMIKEIKGELINLKAILSEMEKLNIIKEQEILKNR